MAKKVPTKNEIAIDKVVDFLIENSENPKDLFKENSIYRAFTKRLTERMLNSEFNDHMGYEKNQKTINENSRNGVTNKTIITENGEIEINIPRDRDSSISPTIIPKRQKRFDKFDEKVLSLYARGMTLSDIRSQLS